MQLTEIKKMRNTIVFTLSKMCKVIKFFLVLHCRSNGKRKRLIVFKIWFRGECLSLRKESN